MMRRLTFSALALIISLTPLTAGAQYLQPEDVLLRDQNAQLVPRSPRAAQETARQQHQQNEQNHPSTIADYGTAGSSSSTAGTPAGTDNDTLHGSAPGDDSPATADKILWSVDMDPATARFLRRLQNARAEQAYQLAARQQILQSTALHSGAPLSGTGPAESATILVMLGAVGWTIWRARRDRLITILRIG